MSSERVRGPEGTGAGGVVRGDAAQPDEQAPRPKREPTLQELLSEAAGHFRGGDLDEALDKFQVAVERAPESLAARNGLGVVLRRKGRLDEALVQYEAALALDPDNAGVHNNLGNLQAERGEDAAARTHYERAIALKPDYAQAHYSLGLVHRRGGELDAAIPCFEAAIAAQPDYAEAHYSLGVVRLARGEFRAGWPEYEWRWQCAQFPGRDIKGAPWAGEDQKGRRLLLHAEQGLGDTLQFVRYVPMVKARGAETIVFCQPQLKALIEAMDGVDQVVAQGEPVPSYHAFAALLSLPGLFGTREATIPADVPYLRAPADRRDKFADVLAAAPQGLRIGVAWSHQPKPEGGGTDAPAPEDFAALADRAGVTLVNLQHGAPADERTRLGACVDPTDRIEDYADMAALLDELDLVIGGDTAVAHLAGALGRPVWVLLPQLADWRWMLAREDSPWYPTMRLFRQTEPGDWSAVFEAVGTALDEMLPQAEINTAEAAPDALWSAGDELIVVDEGAGAPTDEPSPSDEAPAEAEPVLEAPAAPDDAEPDVEPSASPEDSADAADPDSPEPPAAAESPEPEPDRAAPSEPEIAEPETGATPFRSALGRPRFEMPASRASAADGEAEAPSPVAPADYAMHCFLDAHLEAGDLFVDVGARQGAHSLTAATAPCGDVMVMAMEPRPDNAARLRAWITANDLSDRIEVVDVAAGDAGGNTMLDLQDVSIRRVGGGSEIAGSDEPDAIAVPTATLDQLLDSRPALKTRRTVLRIDDPGGEAGIVAGARELMDEERVAALIWHKDATHDTPRGRASIEALLRSLIREGYRFYRFEDEARAGPVVPYSTDMPPGNVFGLAEGIDPLAAYGMAEPEASESPVSELSDEDSPDAEDDVAKEPDAEEAAPDPMDPAADSEETAPAPRETPASDGVVASIVPLVAEARDPLSSSDSRSEYRISEIVSTLSGPDTAGETAMHGNAAAVAEAPLVVTDDEPAPNLGLVEPPAAEEAETVSLQMLSAPPTVARAGDAAAERSDPDRPEPAWDLRARAAAAFLPAGATVLDLGCGAMALESLLPHGCTYIPADKAVRDDRTRLCEVNKGVFPDADDATHITALGFVEHAQDPAACLSRLRQYERPVILSYCPTEQTRHLDRGSLGWANHLSGQELEALLERSGFQIRTRASVDDLNVLYRLEPASASAAEPKSVLVLSSKNTPNFGDRLGFHLINALVPPTATIRYAHFDPWDPPDGDVDLLIVGIGNSLSGPNLSEPLLELAGRAGHSIGIFGTQYRRGIETDRMTGLLDRLDHWYARYEEDALLYGKGRNNVSWLGDWLIDACPMSAWTRDECLDLREQPLGGMPLDRAIAHIQAYRQVISPRMQPLICALTSAEQAACVEQREDGSGARSGKFRSLLLDVFGRSYPEEHLFDIDRAAVAGYKARVRHNLDNLRAYLSEALTD